MPSTPRSRRIVFPRCTIFVALGLCFRYKSRRQLRVRVYSAERSQHLSRAGALSPTPYPDSPLPRAPLVPTTRRRQDLDEQSTAIPSMRGMPTRHCWDIRYCCVLPPDDSPLHRTHRTLLPCSPCTIARVLGSGLAGKGASAGLEHPRQRRL